MMIKRFSILFDTSLRKRMEGDKDFRFCRGMQEALRFISAVLAMYLEPKHWSDYKTRNEALNMYFDSSCAEYRWLLWNFERMSRMPVTLKIWTDASINVLFKFFEKEQKREIAYFSVSFTTENGEPCFVRGR